MAVCESGAIYCFRITEMILGVGVDLVNIERMAASVESETFLRKVFTADEIHICSAYRETAEHFAGKFAAKEAFMKAIGQGIRQEVWFTQIEVLNDENGAPYIRTNGRAGMVVEEMGAEHIHVSISHSDGMAVAVVILEG